MRNKIGISLKYESSQVVPTALWTKSGRPEGSPARIWGPQTASKYIFPPLFSPLPLSHYANFASPHPSPPLKLLDKLVVGKFDFPHRLKVIVQKWFSFTKDKSATSESFKSSEMKSYIICISDIYLCDFYDFICIADIYFDVIIRV